MVEQQYQSAKPTKCIALPVYCSELRVFDACFSIGRFWWEFLRVVVFFFWGVGFFEGCLLFLGALGFFEGYLLFFFGGGSFGLVVFLGLFCLLSREMLSGIYCFTQVIA